MADNLIGKTIGGYTLTQQIGIGGAGTVYLAQSTDGRQVAIKVLTIPPGLSLEQQVELRKRFLREAQVMQSLHHPHILPVESVADDEALQVTYMVMPYIASGTLATRTTKGPLALAATVDYISQIAQALDYAHQQNIIHRDIKLANILVDENNQVFLADFGIVKLFDAMNTTLTNMNQIIGTPGYMSPEQIKSEIVSPATDVYSLSIVAYELLTGKVPFESTTIFTIMQKIATEPPPSPRLTRLDLPLPAEAVILRGLAKDPSQRFPSAGAFAAALAQGMQNTWPAGMQTVPTLPVVVPPMTPPTIATPMIPPTISAPPAPMPLYAPMGNASYPPGGVSYPPNAPTGPMPIVTSPPHNNNNRGLIAAVVALVAAIALVVVIVAIAIPKNVRTNSLGDTPTATTIPDTAIIPTASPTNMPPTPTFTPAPPTPTFTAVPPTYISFSSPEFIPQVGSVPGSNIQVISQNQLAITGGDGTDHWAGNYSAPLMKYPAAGNFVAQVRVSIAPAQEVQAAGLGVKEVGTDNTFIRMARAWDTNCNGTCIIDGANANGTAQALSSTKYTSSTVWLKVSRQGSQFSLFYSADGSQWNQLDTNVTLNVGTNVEVFLLAFSRFNGHPVTAYFDNFQVNSL